MFLSEPLHDGHSSVSYHLLLRSPRAVLVSLVSLLFSSSSVYASNQKTTYLKLVVDGRNCSLPLTEELIPLHPRDSPVMSQIFFGRLVVSTFQFRQEGGYLWGERVGGKSRLRPVQQLNHNWFPCPGDGHVRFFERRGSSWALTVDT